MKLYKQILLIIAMSGKSLQKADKLIKAEIETEDQELKKLLKASIRLYKLNAGSWTSIEWRLSPGDDPESRQDKIMYPTNFDEIKVAINQSNGKIIAYIQEKLDANKPEWQVLAERNGWTPGEKS